MSETTTTKASMSDAGGFGKPDHGLRRRLYAIIFEADTSAGKHFDVFLVAAILLSIGVVETRYGIRLNLTLPASLVCAVRGATPPVSSASSTCCRSCPRTFEGHEPEAKYCKDLRRSLACLAAELLTRTESLILGIIYCIAPVHLAAVIEANLQRNFIALQYLLATIIKVVLTT